MDDSGRLKYIFNASFKFPSEEISEVVYKAIYSDVAREKMREVEVKLHLSGPIVECEVSSKSLAKFRGFLNTLLRLMYLASNLAFLTLDEE